MSATEPRPGLCPICGRDAGYVIPTSGGFQVICGPDFGGCAATGVAGATEAEAVTIWNIGLYLSCGQEAA